MLLSLNWLREFVPYEGTAQALGDALTMLGLEVEDISKPFAAAGAMVVGRVLTCAPHPESDHLSVCTVDVGGAAPAVLDIVCGAANVAAGQKVPVAMVGVAMPDGTIIRKARLRGAPSHGMICSERELGLSEDHTGIMVLDDAVPVGARLAEALGLDDEVLDISVTPNRADALSILGLAREAAMAFALPLTLPGTDLHEHGDEWTAGMPVSVADPEICPLYQLRLIENVVVAPSPPAMRHRLRAVGVRSVSNVVDVTNYVMMELGQPLHAFDRDRLRGRGIAVSCAAQGETVVTLDGQERVLHPGDIMIRDGLVPVALGGVMGASNSEMLATSRNVLLEAAVFHPGHIRRTARRLGLSSEASYRFERGVDPLGCAYALDRAAAMIAALSGGAVRRGVSRAAAKPWSAPRIVFRRERAARLLGWPQALLSAEFCRGTLAGLGCSVEEPEAESWRVRPPSWRSDLGREADLIEEIGRVYGLDRLPETLPSVRKGLDRAGGAESRHAFTREVRAWGSGLGLNEAVCYSFTGHADLDRLRLPREDRIELLNPLSEDLNVLRTALAPGLLAAVRVNIAHGAAGLRLFEIASVFHADARAQTTVAERLRLGLVLYGARHDPAWGWGEDLADYQELRGLVEHFISFLHLSPLTCTQEEHPYLSPCVAFHLNGLHLGHGGRLRPALADAYHARKEVWLAELDLDALHNARLGTNLKFVALPVYPPVRRDITVTLPRGMSVAAVAAHVRGMDIAILEDVSLIDLFEPRDHALRNATYRLTFRHADRTLTDAEADKERAAIADSLIRGLGVTV